MDSWSYVPRFWNLAMALSHFRIPAEALNSVALSHFRIPAEALNSVALSHFRIPAEALNSNTSWMQSFKISDALKGMAPNTYRWQDLKALNLLPIIEYQSDMLNRLATAYPVVSPLPDSFFGFLPPDLNLGDLLEEEPLELPDEIPEEILKRSLDSASAGLALMVAYVVLSLDYPFLWVALEEMQPFIQTALWLILFLELLKRNQGPH